MGDFIVMHNALEAPVNVIQIFQNLTEVQFLGHRTTSGGMQCEIQTLTFFGTPY